MDAGAQYELSDEEVLSIPEDDSEEGVNAAASDLASDTSSDGDLRDLPNDEHANDGRRRQASGTEEKEFDAQGWGNSKRVYYDANAIETEGDALEEEEEALRLQRKTLERMKDIDFGFDDLPEMDAEDQTAGAGDLNVAHGVLLPVEVSESTPHQERWTILRARYPEFEPLANDFLTLQSVLDQLQFESAAEKTPRLQDAQLELPASTVKLIALRAYLSALTLYFTLLASGASSGKLEGGARSAQELRRHPIMECLSHCRNAWKRAQDLKIGDLGAQAQSSTEFDRANGTAQVREASSSQTQSLGTSDGEQKKGKRKKKSNAQKEAEAALLEAHARHRERLTNMQARMDRVSAMRGLGHERLGGNFHTVAPPDADGSDFGEETALADHEAAEKAKRKKSLRFYTAQIAQKANKRDSARRNTGGDTDIPYRERFRDRQLRLNAEAEKRGRRGSGVAGTEVVASAGDAEAALAAESRQAADEDYYNQIAARTRQKAVDKEAHARAQREARNSPGARARRIETVEPDGKRAITYAIERNRGFGPTEKRSVRNPRVKKRRRYDDKLKKLGSMRPQYKGGEGRGGYGGELTGIKSNLVKSVKL